ncbi:MAG: orotate phosphoribosyltransferase [Anaerolineales bacterium]|nr:orotate phosphoribosyltransferase [Anaerolineales bacterium]MCB8952852.1 orotate phosphoribosyltransferase [Ardenticatenales bacterium]
MDPESVQSLAATLFDIGAVQFGNFTLHSGKRSYIYMDLRVLVSFPEALRRVALAYRQILVSLSFDLLAAYPYAALPIGTAIALEMNVPLIYPRKEVKNYGTGKLIEGRWQIGQRAVLIEDLVTSGASIGQAIAPLKAEGLLVEEAVVLIDREQGGRETLREQGYRLHSVMTLSQLLAELEREERITAKQRARVLRTL